MAAITKAEIETYLAREEERKALQRQAKTIGDENGLFEERLVELITDRGGEKKTLLYRGFLLAISLVRGRAAWKKEVIRLAGAAEADKISAAAPMREVLVVERAA